MFPYLLGPRVFDLPLIGETRLFLPSYGVLLALAVVVAWLVWLRLVRREGLSTERLGELGFWVLIAGLVGAKLVLYLVEWRAYFTDPWLFFETIRSAGVIWGGVLGSLLTLVFLARRWGFPLGRTLDTLAIPVALAQAVGRVGCFLAGCCWGKACANPLAVRFGAEGHDNTGVPLGLGLHPVQLYESLSLLVVAAVAYVSFRSPRRRPGAAFVTYLLAYAAARFTVEFFRGDPGRGVYLTGVVPGGLSTGQIMSVGIGIGAAIALAMLPRLPEPQGAPPAEPDRP